MDTLNGKTIGMFGDFMNVATFMLQVVEKHICARFPKAKFSYFCYTAETTDIVKDDAVKPEFDAWLSQVDCVLAFYGAVPSSSLFLGYNAAYMERQGKPTVMAVVPRTYSAGLRGVKARCVPGLRVVSFQPEVLDIFGRSDLVQTEKNMGAGTEAFVGQLIDGETIAAVGTDLGAADRAIDLSGYTVLPGFVDAHVHVAVDDRAFKEDAVCAWAQNGVTTVRELGMLSTLSQQDYAQWLRMNNKKPDTAHVVATGKYIDVAGGYGAGPMPNHPVGNLITTTREAAAAAHDGFVGGNGAAGGNGSPARSHDAHGPC